MSIDIYRFFCVFLGAVMNNIKTSELIKALCKQRKIAVKFLLEQCQINRNFIYDLEHKDIAPASDKLERIADYLNCSVDYLLGRTDNPEINR